MLASGIMSVASERAANGQKLLNRLLFRRELVGRPLRVRGGLLGVWKRCVDLKLLYMLVSGAVIDCS